MGLARQVDEPHVAARIAHGLELRRHHADARAVDVRDATEIDEDFREAASDEIVEPRSLVLKPDPGPARPIQRDPVRTVQLRPCDR
jgi:hypothetical protein